MSTTLVSGERTTVSAEFSKGGQGTSWRVGLMGVVALLLGHVPLLVSYFRRLLLFEHYQFVPLLALGIVWLLWGRLREIPRDELASGMRNGMTVGRLLIGCTTLAIATLFCSPWVGMVSLIVCLGMFLKSLSGRHWKALLPVWALLFLTLRPPLRLDLTLITRLQLETSRIASTVLESLGVMHLMEGNVLVVPQRRFLVEEACSGIHSVFALLTAAAIYAVAMRLTLFRGVLLMASSIFWACFMNLIRIAATIIAFDNFEIDLSAGWLHSATGIVTFFMAVIFLAFTHQMLRFFLDPIDPHKVSYWEQDSNPFVRRWNGSSSRRRTNADFAKSRPQLEQSASVRPMSRVLSLGVFGLATLAALWQIDALKAETLSIEPPAAIANLTSESLPRIVGDWVMRDYEILQRENHPLLSEFSKVWTYSGRTHGAVVSVDYPFRGWHQLSGCYQAQGWEIDSYSAVPLTGSDGRMLSEVRMHRPTGEQGLLFFVLMNNEGQPLRDPAVESFLAQTIGRAIERVQRPFATRFPELAPNSVVTTQLQMLITSGGEEIPPDVSQAARGHFTSLQTNVAGMLTGEVTVAMQGGTP